MSEESFTEKELEIFAQFREMVIKAIEEIGFSETLGLLTSTLSVLADEVPEDRIREYVVALFAGELIGEEVSLTSIDFSPDDAHKETKH